MNPRVWLTSALQPRGVGRSAARRLPFRLACRLAIAQLAVNDRPERTLLHEPDTDPLSDFLASVELDVASDQSVPFPRVVLPGHCDKVWWLVRATEAERNEVVQH